MNSVASQSSRSGCDGGSPRKPKLSEVVTKPVPKYSCQIRLTVTRAVSGFSGEPIQRAKVEPARKGFLGSDGGQGHRRAGRHCISKLVPLAGRVNVRLGWLGRDLNGAGAADVWKRVHEGMDFFHGVLEPGGLVVLRADHSAVIAEEPFQSGHSLPASGAVREVFAICAGHRPGRAPECPSSCPIRVPIRGFPKPRASFPSRGRATPALCTCRRSPEAGGQTQALRSGRGRLRRA